MFEEKMFSLTEKDDAIKTLIVVFIDFGYLSVFNNWYKFSAPFLNGNLLVVTLDAKTNDVIEQNGLMSYSLDWNGDLSHLWIERVKLFKQLLELGYDVIHSDADAVWLDNPVFYCEKLGVDAAFSQGTIWPPKVHKKLGVVLCCGFFYLNSNPQTIELLNEWQQAVMADGDDQRALNELLLSKGLNWDEKEDYRLNWQEKYFRCFNEVQISKLSCSTKLALLPHSLFQRLPEAKRALVKHPLSPKNGTSTEEILIINKCWSIR